MRRKVYLHSSTSLDILQIYSWYENQRDGLGKEFEMCLEAALDYISKYPKAGKLIKKSVRRVIIKRFPYGIYYRLKKSFLEVVGVRHFSRTPIYKIRLH